MRTAEAQTEPRRQVAAFAALSLLVATVAVVLAASHSALFQPYFGSLHPLPVITLVIVIGAVCLYLLTSRGWFQILNTETVLRGIGVSAALVVLFSVEVTIADIVVGFPEDINVPPPQSFMFYPVIAYVVEVIFHLLPLTLLLVALGPRGRISNDRWLWVCILATALLEPAFQLQFAEKPLSWFSAYLWVHLYAFNLLQLWVFRRYDFVSMYSFRILYYAYWHIAWGYARLQVLF